MFAFVPFTALEYAASVENFHPYGIDNFSSPYIMKTTIFNIVVVLLAYITIIPCYLLHGLFIYTLIKTHKTEKSVRQMINF